MSVRVSVTAICVFWLVGKTALQLLCVCLFQLLSVSFSCCLWVSAVVCEFQLLCVCMFQLACTLPDKELMSQIVAALLEHISNPSHSYASLLPCVRTLVMLTEHDYGFYHLKVWVPLVFSRWMLPNMLLTSQQQIGCTVKYHFVSPCQPSGLA